MLLIKYLRTMGFEVANEPFESSFGIFRNVLAPHALEPNPLKRERPQRQLHELRRPRLNLLPGPAIRVH